MDLPYSSSGKENGDLILTSEGGSGIELNGLFIGKEEDLKNIVIVPLTKSFTPAIASDDSVRNIRLKYDDVDTYYGLAWDFSPSVVRMLLNDELDFFFRRYVHEHVQTKLVGNRQGFYSNTYMRPLELSPNSDQTVYGFNCNGNEIAVKQKLAELTGIPSCLFSR